MEFLERPEATAEEGLGPLIALQDNAAQFFDAFVGSHSDQIACTKGCSGCCHVDISIFTSEAARILGWMRSLDQATRESLEADLRTRAENDRARSTPTAPNPTGKQNLPCAFLIDNACSIYPARPIICRTQGALLRWQTNKQAEPKKQKSTKGTEPILQFDVCPLNFKKAEKLPEDREALDLDRLTQLQSIAQQHWEKISGAGATGANRISLTQLRELVLRRLVVQKDPKETEGLA
jgi:Fe-S-cluster containining protein